MTQQCVNCPGAEDHSTAQCPLVSEQNKDAELLPCPHCNGGAEMRLYDGDYFVQCVECFASTAADYQTEQAAAEKWNRRSLPVGVPDGWPCLERPAKVGAGVFSAGLSARLVIEAAYRQHEYAEEPPFTDEQIKSLATLAASPTVKAEQVRCDPRDDGPDITTKNGYPAYSISQHERIVAALSAQQSAHVSVPTDAELVEMARKLGALPELCYAEDHPDIRWRIRPEIRALVRALLNGGEA
jgi:hypothetical protein